MWPLGREKPASVISAFSGRGLWASSFAILIAMPVTRIAAAKRIAFFFESLM